MGGFVFSICVYDSLVGKKLSRDRIATQIMDTDVLVSSG